MRKVCVVITARPSYARIKTVLEAINNHPHLELMIIVAASAIIDRYGHVSRVIEKDGFKITAEAMTLIEGENPEAMAKTTGLGILELSSLFSFHKPDMVMTIADRYETIATAISASYLNIPLLHIQGGEVTGNIDDKVRHSVTKLADFHFVANDDSYTRIIKMGEHPEVVFNTGCPSIDLAKRSLELPSLDLADAVNHYGGVGSKVNQQSDYLVVLQHPVTNEYSEAMKQIQETLDAVHSTGIQALWFWPNPDSGSDATSRGIRIFRESTPENRIRFLKNMEPEAFLKIVRNAKCIVGNSSVAIRECAFLGIPAVNIGTRQVSRQRGSNVLDVHHDSRVIRSAIEIQSAKSGLLSSDHVYGDGNSGLRIAEHCATLTLKSTKKIAY